MKVLKLYTIKKKIKFGSNENVTYICFTKANKMANSVTLDASKFSFKGNSSAILKMKSEVEKVQNEIGQIVSFTFGTYTVAFGKKKITVPKSWVVIL